MWKPRTSVVMFFKNSVACVLLQTVRLLVNDDIKYTWIHAERTLLHWNLKMAFQTHKTEIWNVSINTYLLTHTLQALSPNVDLICWIWLTMLSNFITVVLPAVYSQDSECIQGYVCVIIVGLLFCVVLFLFLMQCVPLSCVFCRWRS